MYFSDVSLDSCLCCVGLVGVKVCDEGSVFENGLFHLSATWVLLCEWMKRMYRKLSFLSEFDAWSLRWVLSGSICVSVSRCWMFVSAVQPCDHSECGVLGCLEFVEICVGDDG